MRHKDTEEVRRPKKSSKLLRVQILYLAALVTES